MVTGFDQVKQIIYKSLRSKGMLLERIQIGIFLLETVKTYVVVKLRALS